MTPPSRGDVDGRRQGLKWFSLLAGIGIVVLGVYVVAGRWAEIRPALVDIGWGRTTVAVVVTAIGVAATAECWRVWLSSLGDSVPRSVAHRLFYVTQAGKYLPGAVWPIVAQAALARRHGISRANAVASTTLFLALHTVTGVAVGAALLGGVTEGPWSWVLYPVAVLATVALLPPVLTRLLAFASRLSSHVFHGADPGWKTTGMAAASMLVAWIAYGTATWVLLSPLSAGPGALRLAIGGYALSWIVGFLAVAMPAGVGVREAVLVSILAPAVGVAAAVSVALVSRFAVTVVDLGLAAWSSGVLKDGPRPEEPRSGGLALE